MTEYRANFRKLRVKSSEDTSRRIVAYLRRTHPRKTAEEVSAATGLHATTVATWLEGSTVPGGVAMLRLIEAYGPDFLASAMPTKLGWLSDAARAARQAHLEAEQRRIEQEIAELQS